MRNTLWLICGTMLSCSLLAQAPSTAPSGAAGAGQGASGVSRPAIHKVDTERELRSTPLKPGRAQVIAVNVNVRGQPKLRSEVITRLDRNQEVTVLDEILLEESEPDEPSAWAKIRLPEGTRVWVSALFVDPDSKKVTANLLNLRGGPGENYSILGRIERGTEIEPLTTKDDWIQIEAPESAYAFMAAQYLSQETTAAVAQTDTVTAEDSPDETAAKETPPVVKADTQLSADTQLIPSAVTNAPDIASTTVDVPMVQTNTAPAKTNEIAGAAQTGLGSATTNTVADVSDTQETEEPPPPRIVQREGVVRGTISIQAPTRFELFSPESTKTINYLYTSSPHLDLSRYKGLRIIVTGEEGLDERWRNTPVLTIQRLQVLE